jgi:chaperone BCS1
MRELEEALVNMDFNRLFSREALPTFSANTTEAAANMSRKGLNDGLIEYLVPLLGGRYSGLSQILMLVYNITGKRLGVDPTLILTTLGFLWAVSRLWRQVSMFVSDQIRAHLTVSITISSNDEMFIHTMNWLSKQPRMFDSRSLTAESTSKTAWEEEEEDTELTSTNISADGTGVILNFSNQEAKSVS